jgi:hypothetical protein
MERITHDGMLDLISVTSDPDWAIRSRFSHSAVSSFTATARFFGMAEISVSLGEIKDTDTPSNWVEWAKKKGYSTDHLQQYVEPVKLPEKGPSTAIGRVALEVAYEIKRESGTDPTARDVMKRLRQHAKNGDKYEYVLTPSPENYRGNGVYWITDKYIEKDFTLHACGKTLERHYK